MSLSPFRLRFDPAIEIADISFSLLVRVNSVNLFADRMEHREGRDPGSDKDLGPNGHHDRVWHKHGRLDGIEPSIIAGIAAVAHHLQPTLAPGDGWEQWRPGLQFHHAGPA